MAHFHKRDSTEWILGEIVMNFQFSGDDDDNLKLNMLDLAKSEILQNGYQPKYDDDCDDHFGGDDMSYDNLA